jgi:transcription elongation factor Elf1
MKPEELGNRTPFERIPKDSVKFFRILPPYGANHQRQLFHKYQIHWGFLDENGNKKPVACSYPTEGFCPVCNSVKEIEEQVKRKKESGASDEECSTLNEMMRERRSQKFYVYNAVSYDEKKVVILQLPYTASEELKRKMMISVQEKGFDPTSVQSGVWFRFERTGAGLKTKYHVDFKKMSVMVDGEELEKNDRSPLPEALLGTIVKQYAGEIEDGPLVDIHDIYETRTAQELGQYMNGSPVKSNRVDASAPVATTGQTTFTPAMSAPPPTASPPPQQEMVQQAPPTQQQPAAQATTQPAAASSIQDEIARLQALQAQVSQGAKQ